VKVNHLLQTLTILPPNKQPMVHIANEACLILPQRQQREDENLLEN
jgi:hypothetical protein